jgi:CoA:oxalate CoA-transferase
MSSLPAHREGAPLNYPLHGIRVLDMSRVLAGPFAGRMLGDLGADVVKVEPPDGDVTRLWGKRVNGISGYFHSQNVGKRGICVDLSAAAGPDIIRTLVREADVLIENFRPGVMARYGLDYAALQAINPRLVMLSISGFGQQGPEAERAAYAAIIHAETGLMARQAEQSQSRPADMAVSFADFNAGLHGLVALLSALLLRERTGSGQHIDMAMVDAMLITDDHLHHWLEDAVALKNMPSEVWQTPGGAVVLAGDFRHIWRQLNRICGVADPAAAEAPVEEKARLRRAATQRFFDAMPGREAVIEALEKMNIAWGDVRTNTQAFELPTVKHRRSIDTVDDRGGGQRPVVASPYRFSAAESGTRRGAPLQGEHNAEVLADWAGADAALIERWVEAGALVARSGD